MSEANFADVTPHEKFERGWNRLQIVIEIVVGLVVLGGLLGLFGGGPLSTTQGSLRDRPISISYDRLLRRTVQSKLTIDMTRPIESKAIEIELPTDFLQNMDVVETSPRSSAMRAEADGVTYVFDLGASRSGQIALSIKPRTFGFLHSTLKMLGTQIALHQFVFP